MQDSEQGPGFAPKTRILALLRLGAAVLTVSLAGCPGVQISRTADSAAAESTPVVQSAPTPAPTPTPTPTPPPITGSATLVWQAPTDNIDGTPITDLAGYRIHFGASTQELNQVIEVDGAASTSYVINSLASGTYYFAVSAYNAFGIEGALSDIAIKSF